MVSQLYFDVVFNSQKFCWEVVDFFVRLEWAKWQNKNVISNTLEFLAPQTIPVNKRTRVCVWVKNLMFKSCYLIANRES